MVMKANQYKYTLIKDKIVISLAVFPFFS